MKIPFPKVVVLMMITNRRKTRLKYPIPAEVLDAAFDEVVRQRRWINDLLPFRDYVEDTALNLIMIEQAYSAEEMSV